ncbi:hypothetical protein C8J57DRAFT_357572 [Mycena rebaudengoi]|nr:hypothetical protein C8J57DRAFT_357572 [Mycena rebaudengoi]
MDATTLPPIPPDIAMITGPTMIGICFNWGLMGVLLVQLYFYHVNFAGDTLRLKALVYGIIMLDILQTGMVTADAFHWFVYGFGNMNQLDSVFLNSWDVPFLDAVIALVAQIFYCWRIYFLRKLFVFPVIIALISIMGCAGGIVTALNAYRHGKLHLIGSQVTEQTIWLVGSAVSDVVIAAVLCWRLLCVDIGITHPSRSLIARIVQLIVETNALTASVAVVALILFWAVPQHPTLVVPPTAIIGKLYTNCLITVLNNRKGRDAPSTRVLNSANTTVPAFNPPSGVHISRTQKVHIDLEDFPPVEMDDFPKPSASELDSRSYE